MHFFRSLSTAAGAWAPLILTPEASVALYVSPNGGMRIAESTVRLPIMSESWVP